MKAKKIIMISLVLSMLFMLTGCFSITGNGNLEYDDSQYAIGSGRSMDSFDKIDIEWVNGSIKLVSSNNEYVSITEPEGFSDEQQLRWQVQDNCLSIYYCKANTNFNKAIKHKDLVISLPKNISLDELKIDSVSASIRSDVNLNLDKVNIDNVSGNIVLSGITAEKVKFDTVSGNLSGTLGALELQVDSVSGSIDFDLIKIPESIEGSTVSGDLALTMDNCEPVELEIDDGFDNFYSDFHSTEGAHRNFEFETVSGQISLMRK